MLPYLQLTPAFQQWTGATPTDDGCESYCDYHRRIDLSLCLIPIFWPTFVEVQGLILRQPGPADNWDTFLASARQAQWDDTAIEYVANHLHMSDLFLNDPNRDQIDHSVFVFLASNIAEMWQAKLRMQYPDKNFRVGIDHTDEESDVEVYVYTDRGT